MPTRRPDRSGFTVVVAGMIRGIFSVVIEAVYVPDASDPAEAGLLATARFEAATGIAVIPAEIYAGHCAGAPMPATAH